MSYDVLERTNWLDKSISFYTGNIYEYDMKEGGFSIIKELKLLDKDTIDELSLLTKEQRKIQIGKLQRTNKELRDGLKEGFTHFRLLFGKSNNLSNEDIISVKKDAIFVKRYCQYTMFHDDEIVEDDGSTTLINFREKNVYSSVMLIDKFEFYLKEKGFVETDELLLDVKGLSDDNMSLHTNGMLVLIQVFMNLLVDYDYLGAKRYIVKMMNLYKKRELPVEYYRELNDTSAYRLIINDNETSLKEVGESYKNELIIDYNYVKILVPILNITIPFTR